MQEHEVSELAANGLFRDRPIRGKIEETHISWVILGKQDVFKIKKPLKLSFLDFSTLQLRKKYCKREVSLNRRFTDIYLSVLPLRKHKDRWEFGGHGGKLTDYAVHMKKMDPAKRMDKLLRKGGVSAEDMQTLAGVVAAFHQQAAKINFPFDLRVAQNLFADIATMQAFLKKNAGTQAAAFIGRAINWSNSFLQNHSSRLQRRIGQGFKRDLHGDLHSGNIFLYSKPVLFDCIEFNDSYRQIDLLYEIAFLCMDLEAADHHRLVKPFLDEYTRLLPCFTEKEDQSIFNYFKCLRANVRAKVHAIGAGHADTAEEKEEHLAELNKYLTLMKAYGV